MRLDDKLKKFLRSKYGEQLVQMAKLRGQEEFKLGTTYYKVSDLLNAAETLKLNPNM